MRQRKVEIDSAALSNAELHQRRTYTYTQSVDARTNQFNRPATRWLRNSGNKMTPYPRVNRPGLDWDFLWLNIHKMSCLAQSYKIDK